MTEPYMKCPCGFEARTANAEELFQAHTCPNPPHLIWAATALLLGFLAMIVLIAWVI